MTTLLFMLPWVASVCGAVMIGKALRLWEIQPGIGDSRKRLLALLSASLLFPSFARAQAVDLQTAVESGNAIIMYLSGTLAAVGIIAAGVAMMMGRQSIAKWAFAGAFVSGLAFAIVRTMWENFGLTAPDVSTFTP
jgi:type IV secretory pathway VirB2 component (pilin)